MKEYYPIGTVVMLQGGDRPIMIYGRAQIQSNSNLVWDYVACLYPEGNLGDEHTIFFNHDEIEKVLHMGMTGEYEDRMLAILNDARVQNIGA